MFLAKSSPQHFFASSNTFSRNTRSVLPAIIHTFPFINHFSGTYRITILTNIIRDVVLCNERRLFYKQEFYFSKSREVKIPLKPPRKPSEMIDINRNCFVVVIYLRSLHFAPSATIILAIINVEGEISTVVTNELPR